MRTTVSIQDHLLKKAKEASLRRNCTLGEVIEDALRTTLVSQVKDRKKTGIAPLKTYRGTGVQAGIDLASSAELLEVMEGR